MQIVIEIDEDVRVAISRMGLLRVPDEMQKKVDEAIQHGKPLPKGHGRLIDADKLLNSFELSDFDGDEYDCISTACRIVNSMPTIIEADKEQE